MIEFTFSGKMSVKLDRFSFSSLAVAPGLIPILYCKNYGITYI